MAAAFFTEAVAWQKAKGYIVHHETHRKRFLYSPWVARNFVPRYRFVEAIVFFDQLLKFFKIVNYESFSTNIDFFVNNKRAGHGYPQGRARGGSCPPCPAKIVCFSTFIW